MRGKGQKLSIYTASSNNHDNYNSVAAWRTRVWPVAYIDGAGDNGDDIGGVVGGSGKSRG